MKFTKILFITLLILSPFLNITKPLRASNNKLETKNKIARVVALTSLSADIVSRLNNNSIVGIPGSSLLKKNNKFIDKTIVSSGRMPPNLEKIIKLKPELVIGSSGFHDKTLKQIEDLGVETLSVRITNFDDLEKMFTNIQILLGKNKELKLNNLIPNCYKSSSEVTEKRNKQILVLVSSKPILSPNSKSWAGNMINRFDHINLTSQLDSKSQFKGYVNLNPEWVISSKPSNIIIINTPGSNDSQYTNMKIWKDLPAVNTNKVFKFDYYGLINPGSLDSINNACQKLSTI